ncbi:MAG TPA: VCBS repeat-containing protein, partial [Verrucomicrobiae bacterium]|nr:VCBS repeat-containing protein [Verrucomicrobiae bacterium]
GVSTLLGNGDGTFQPALTKFVSTGNGSAASGDLNHDGNLDLVLPNSTAKGVNVLLGNGDGTFGTATNFNIPTSLASSLYALAVADLNHDGNQDVVAVEQLASNAVTVLLGDGTGKLTVLTNYALGSAAAAVAIADLNNDGIPDLLVGTVGGYIQVMLGKGDGTFAIGAQLPVAGAGAIAVADFNNDGQPDIVSAGNGSISVLLNEFLPPLQIAQTATQVILSWPTYATGFQVTTTTNCASGSSWAVVTNAPTVSGSMNVLTNSITDTTRFYRLQN